MTQVLPALAGLALGGAISFAGGWWIGRYNDRKMAEVYERHAERWSS